MGTNEQGPNPGSGLGFLGEGEGCIRCVRLPWGEAVFWTWPASGEVLRKVGGRDVRTGLQWLDLGVGGFAETHWRVGEAESMGSGKPFYKSLDFIRRRVRGL